MAVKNRKKEKENIKIFSRMEKTTKNEDHVTVKGAPKIIIWGKESMCIECLSMKQKKKKNERNG